VCGFFSTYLNNKSIDKELNQKCIDSLKLLNHRGPDDTEYINYKNNFLGFSRLSIIDKDNGKQPMFNHDKSMAIIFNGEIFNYKELRKHLIDKSINLKTNSDTEVVLNLYLIYKKNIYKYLRGMFSFVIYNFKNNEVYGARDRFGIKPFYYHNSNDGDYLFSSEPKSIRKYFNNSISFNINKISEFIIFGYSADHESFYDSIKILKPGHSFLIKDNRMQINREWEPFENHDEEIKITEKDALIKLEKLFDETIDLWLTSDVPVASLMSGGIDSSAVTSSARKFNNIKSFSVIFPDDQDINEQQNIEDIIKHSKITNSEIIPFKENLVHQNINDVVKSFDAPINDPNNMTLYALCNKIKKNFDYKVVLCGEGADELFAGYPRHIDFYNKIKKNKNDRELVLGNNYLSIQRLKKIDWNLDYEFSERNKILENLNSKKLLNKILEYDQKTFLQSRLYCQDMIGMANSIEIRTPFLEHKFAEFINSLPVEFKHNGIYTKYLFRCVAEKFLPKNVCWDKKKVALNIPYSKLLKKGFLNEIFIQNINKNSKISEFCNIEKLINLFNVHQPNHITKDHSNTLWRLLALELWLKNISSP
jgi:asparagine synthase (glutamine-hydrolysing)